jgi:hypothetical protein
MNGIDASVTEGINFNYAIPGLLGEYVRIDRGVDVGFWRAVGPGYTKFAVECTLDEIASSIAADPLELRLRLSTANHARSGFWKRLLKCRHGKSVGEKCRRGPR